MNYAEVDTWLFEHVVNQGHTCNAIKNHNGLNIGFVDTETQEKVFINYI